MQDDWLSRCLHHRALPAPWELVSQSSQVLRISATAEELKVAHKPIPDDHQQRVTVTVTFAPNLNDNQYIIAPPEKFRENIAQGILIPLPNQENDIAPFEQYARRTETGPAPSYYYIDWSRRLFCEDPGLSAHLPNPFIRCQWLGRPPLNVTFAFSSEGKRSLPKISDAITSLINLIFHDC